LVTKEVAKAKKPVFAAKYHSLSQTCDKRIIYCRNHTSETCSILPLLSSTLENTSDYGKAVLN